MTVNDLLVGHFSEIVDYNFTVRMEEDLDEIAEGNRNWPEVIRSFYTPFAEQLSKAQAEMPTAKAELEKIGRECPKCGHDLVIRWGRFGKFISCSNFPGIQNPGLKKSVSAVRQTAVTLSFAKHEKAGFFMAVPITQLASLPAGSSLLHSAVQSVVAHW